VADFAELATAVGEAAAALGVRVAVAESLTGGMLSSALAQAPEAGEWFAGGVVAYGSDVKHNLLEVPPGPVVSGPSARAMASTTARLLAAEFAVSLTGAGGPDPQDGERPGTVFLGLHTPSGVCHRRFHFDGGPEAVCRSAVHEALLALHHAMSGRQVLSGS
jgi:nicotinamide-nucleotide amidase